MPRRRKRFRCHLDKQMFLCRRMRSQDCRRMFDFLLQPRRSTRLAFAGGFRDTLRERPRLPRLDSQKFHRIVETSELFLSRQPRLVKYNLRFRCTQNQGRGLAVACSTSTVFEKRLLLLSGRRRRSDRRISAMRRHFRCWKLQMSCMT